MLTQYKIQLGRPLSKTTSDLSKLHREQSKKQVPKRTPMKNQYPQGVCGGESINPKNDHLKIQLFPFFQF